MNLPHQFTHPQKQHVLQTLESYQNVPKDDKLIIRKYISTLKDLHSNTLVKLILSKGKEADDRKLQILLRKEANFIRKKQQATLLSKKIDKPFGKQNIQNIKPSQARQNKLMLKIHSVAHSKQKDSRSLNSSRKKNSIVSPKASPRLKTVESSKFVNFDRNNESGKRSIKGLQEITNLIRQRQNYEMPTQFTEDITEEKVQGNKNRSAKDQNTKEHKHTRSRSWDQFFSSPGFAHNQRTITFEGQDFLTQCKNLGTCQKQIQRPMNVFCQATSLISSNYQSLRIYDQNFSNKQIHKQFKNLQLLAEEFFDFLVPQFLRMKSPSSFSLPYHQLMSKIASYLITLNKHKQKCQEMAKKLLDKSSNCTLVFFPFQSEFDIVTIDKLSQFMKEYFEPKLSENPIRNLFMRINIGVEASKQFQFKYRDKISVFDFKEAYQWKSGDVGYLFQKLVLECNLVSMELSYWEFYWLKYRKEFQEFYDAFYRN